MSTTTRNCIVQPYLFFDGRCEEALGFYRNALDAEVTTLVRFKDSPDPTMCAPGSNQKVMHASLRIGATTVMASDGRCGGHPSFQGFALSLSVHRGRSQPAVCGLGEWRTGADAVGQDLLFSALRNGRQPLWRVLDGYRRPGRDWGKTGLKG